MSVEIVMEFLGVTGSLIICGSVIPQVIKTYRTKSARDLSITYLTTLMIGIVLLTIYSIYIRDMVFIFGNVLSLLSVVILIGLWRRYYYKGLCTGIKR
jgi:MtN3 and saliva related transmembrane protein